MAEPRVVAVSVTFNRSDLVTRLVRAVAAQTRPPEEIVVVDNASSDDTVARLEAVAPDLGVPLRVLRQDLNGGGAGGFHAGLVDFVAGEGDLVWLMDDDGVPDPDCLELLLPHLNVLDFVGPAVIDEAEPTRLTFPIRLPGRAQVVHALADVERAARDGAHDGVVEGVVIPFNGVLVTRELVERIGPVDPKFFIWGDDVEYLWRAKRAGARVGTVVAARFRHPAVGELGTPMMGGHTTYNHSPSDLKHYCMARNNTANLREYSGPLGVAAFAVKSVWFYLLTRPDRRRLRLSLEGIGDGWTGRWGKHARYLS